MMRNNWLGQNWWKLLSGILLVYAVIMGFAVDVPDTMIAHTIRNVFYHVGMWSGMFTAFLISFVFSLRYLSGFKVKEDIRAIEAARVGLVFGILGIATGMIWARFTWGRFWVSDPKLNGAAVGIFVYLAYLILRGSIEDTHKRAKVSAVYNVFAFILLIVFILILPRIASASIHPGKDGNPVLPMELAPGMRIVFYPAMVGWILLSIWIWQIRVRMNTIRYWLNTADPNQ
jgi:heme exporter protein C